MILILLQGDDRPVIHEPPPKPAEEGAPVSESEHKPRKKSIAAVVDGIDEEAVNHVQEVEDKIEAMGRNEKNKESSSKLKEIDEAARNNHIREVHMLRLPAV